jgi:hypothetical protein
MYLGALGSFASWYQIGLRAMASIPPSLTPTAADAADPTTEHSAVADLADLADLVDLADSRPGPPPEPLPRMRRRLSIALTIYTVSVAVFAILAGDRLFSHTQYNHFAHLADAWLHGRHSIVDGGPSYAGGNDFALFAGKTYVSFPPFPALLMMPLVWLSGSPENFRDAQFIVWVAGLGPALLFLALERFRDRGESARSERENIGLALIFAFGTVYFFTAVQGTVWFAGHVVGVALLCGYLWAAQGATHPVLSGILIGCAFLTRPTMSYVALFFGLELFRAHCKEWPETGRLWSTMRGALSNLNLRPFLKQLLQFSAPIIVALTIATLYNFSRFRTANPAAFGHEYLTVQWHERIAKWGLFGLHYLPKNLGCFLTLLPWPHPHLFLTLRESLAGKVDDAPFFRINEHGLALWFTTPVYLWLLWPKRTSFVHTALLGAALLPLCQNLLYQNSGWQQFGYRFSNDYAPLLFAMMAVGGRPLGNAWRACAAWGVAWNLFGALSFGRPTFERYYFRESTQTILYQPD